MVKAFLGSAIVGYALGAIPTGVVVARAWGNVDLTQVGSGRTGATNVLRTLGPVAAALVFGGDGAKGALAVAMARRLGGGDVWAQLVAAIASTLGHAYSPFIGFKGGRGVVTGMSATAVVAPLQMVLALLSGAVLIAATRYVSLGSMVGACVGGALMVRKAAQTGQVAYAAWGIVVAGFIVVSHRDNLQRLLDGTERKIGQKAADE